MSKKNKVKAVQKVERNLTSDVKREAGDMEVGQIWFSKSSYDREDVFIRIEGFEWDYHEEHLEQGRDVKPTLKVRISESEDGKVWTPKEYLKDASDIRRYRIQFTVPIGVSAAEAIEELQKDVLESFMDPSKLELELNTLSSDTSVVPTQSMDYYKTAVAMMDERKRRVEIIRAMAEQKLSAMSHIAYELQKEVDKVMKVVHILELYLGVKEQIFQLQDGLPADVNEPVCVRQQILYMDEECGITEFFEHVDRDGSGVFVRGLDWESVDQFDEWLLEDEHYKIVIPETRGIVVIRPSRHHKVTGDPITDAIIRMRNMAAYLLIRNGEKLYRIATGEKMGDVFFPTIAEDVKIVELLEASRDWDREKGEDARAEYIRNTLILQGLIDRTAVFHPLPDNRDLTKESAYGKKGFVRLIRDAEATLPDGNLRYSEWKDEINSKVERGTRIFITGVGYTEKRYMDDRFGRYYTNEYSMPPVPGVGVYTVVDVKPVTDRYAVSKRKFKIMYNPEDTIYTYWEYHERKYRVSFWIYEGDGFYLNYDLLDLDIVRFYMESRIERPNYLEVLPALANIYEERKEELANEEKFVDLVASDLDCSENMVWEAVEWWKHKVIWKRPIREDDDKAWRMIRKRLARKLTKQ